MEIAGKQWSGELQPAGDGLTTAAPFVAVSARMRRKVRLLVLLAILLFVLHVIATFAATTAFNADASIPARFGPTFALALCSLPLLHLSVFNSIIVAIVISAIVELLPLRAAVAILASIPILLVATMIGATTLLDWRTDRGWRELQPAAITPAPLGTLAITLNSSGAAGDYLSNEIRRDGIHPPPQAADWFLVAHRADVIALRGQLPWRSTSRQRYAMTQLLLADALQTHSVDDIEAARRITSTLLHERRLEAASLAIASAHQRLLVARKLGMAGAAGFDPHRQLIAAIYAQSVDMRALSAPWYARLYARVCVAESAYSAMRQARVIRDLRGMHFKMPPQEDPQPRVPWNPLSVLGNGGRLAWRANELLNLEARTSR